ncbi:MAG TPA: dihydrofolate reductase family protein [Jatrophihabitans sp.]|nr:dihydrofolate reductase family protein [Jatrophihabitans sp.]
MPLTQYYTATSLDGFIADERNSLDWLFQFDGEPDAAPADPDSPFRYERFIADVGALAMGATTYEWVRAHLAAADPGPGAGSAGDGPASGGWPYQQPTWVFSHRSLPAIPGADLRFVSGPVTPVHAEMTAAAGGRNLWLVGGGDLVGQFHDAGLLDELLLTVAPVTLGAGAPLLPRRISTPPLRLVSSEPVGPFLAMRYRVDRSVAGGGVQPAG